MPRRRWGYALLVLAVIAFGALLHRPGLDSGLVADDFLQRAMLDGTFPVHRAAFDLYSFVDAGRGELQHLMNAGTYPWWVHPDLKLTALRPLSSLLIALDARVLGLSDRGAHLHSLLWFAFTVASLALLLQRLLPPRVALLATAIYAFDPLHVTPVAWLANRNVLVSATFALLALWGHVRWREQGWKPGVAVSGLGFALSLAGGEYALSALGYLIAYELVGARGAWRKRAAALLPAAIPTVIYVSLHLALGYGAKGSSVYVDPLRSPGWFILLSMVRLPALLVNELLSIPGELTHAALILGYVQALLFLLPPLVILGALVPGMMRRLSEEERRVLHFLLVGNGLSIVPLLGTVPSPRLLVVPAVGGTVLVALLVRDGVRQLRDSAARRRIATWWRGFVTTGLAVAHLLVAPMFTVGAGIGWTAVQMLVRSLYLRGEIDDRRVSREELVLLNSFEPMTLIYPPWVRHHDGRPLPRVWRALTTTPAAEHLVRTSPTSFELTAVGGVLLDLATTDLLRSADAPLHAGQHFAVTGLQIDVVEMARWGPTKVRFSFDTNLDNPALVFLTMSVNGLRRFRMPRVGGSANVPGAPLHVFSRIQPP